MSELAEPLRHALEKTGYLSENGQEAAPSVALAHTVESPMTSGPYAWQPSFEPDAWWRSNPEPFAPGVHAGGLTVYFKFTENPEDAPISDWQSEIWNRGFSPLLWIVSPQRVDLYNGYAFPRTPNEADANRLHTFELLDSRLIELETLAGRLAMETGQFWCQEPRIDRRDSVDRRLTADIASLEQDLLAAGLARGEAQGLIGRSIFAKYLVDRRIVTEQALTELCGHGDLAEALGDSVAIKHLFDWLAETFNGDMFRSPPGAIPSADHLQLVSRFLKAEDPETGQLSLFPYRFDVIPVELISSIYEQFVHSEAADTADESETTTARRQGVYYTPLPAVSLVLDEVFNGLTGDETVLDLTCGSGVFLVEALRRLVYLRTLRSAGGMPTREVIRDTLHRQVHGVDSSEAAVRVAAFSLYLAALELDPKPQPPHALKFEPLEGRNLLVGDAHKIVVSPPDTKTLAPSNGAAKFDVIIGNPPWSFRGRAGTQDRKTRGSGSGRSPRGESLDFVGRAKDFAHERTRFGLILSATPFFSRSATGITAARQMIESLSPVTLVNLSELSQWLFRKANMPAMALLARHREQPADQITLVQAHWSPAGEQSHTIELAPSDITTLPLASWKRNAGLFKAGFLGRQPDLLFLDRLWERYDPLKVRLEALGTGLRTGLTFGNRSRDAGFLHGMPLIGSRELGRFLIPETLPAFDQDRAQWPRQREIYKAPLLLVREFLQRDPRPVVAVSERDLVFRNSIFGVALSGTPPDLAYLLSGILSSSLASLYVLMTGSTFGLWIQRLQSADFASLPMPDLEAALRSDAGRRVAKLARSFHHAPRQEPEWDDLDSAVCDLYGLTKEERIVVRDGLFRGNREWKPGRLRSTAPAELAHLRQYAQAFLQSMDDWFSVSKQRRMRADVYCVPHEAPLRVVRFVIEDTPGPSVLNPITPKDPLKEVLQRIGQRTQVPITSDLVGLRELRVHAEDEVTIIKPAARRHWLGVCGLEDADLVVRDSARDDLAA